MYKGIGDIIPLVIIVSKPVGRKVEPTKAEGSVFVDAGDDAFPCIRTIFAKKTACLDSKLIPVEDGVELVEGERPRAAGTDEEQVALLRGGAE